MNYSDIRLEKAEKCSCMSTPPSRNELKELPRAEANIKLKIMEKSQTEGWNGEMRPLLKWCECNCGNKPAKTQNIYLHASWTDLTPVKIRFLLGFFCYITSLSGHAVIFAIVLRKRKTGSSFCKWPPLFFETQLLCCDWCSNSSQKALESVKARRGSVKVFLTQTLNDLIVAAAVFPLKVPCCLKCRWIWSLHFFFSPPRTWKAHIRLVPHPSLWMTE